MRIKDISGQKFGHLTVIKYAGLDTDRKAKWFCRCDCGNYTVRLGVNLRKGTVISCCACHYKGVSTHGEANKTRLYRIWKNMHARCNNPSIKSYKDYGGRGIIVCSEWDDYQNFKEWANNNGYSDELSIDRIDVNGNYTPENCKWSTNRQQCRNKRNNKVLKYNGESHLEVEWAEMYGLTRWQLHARLKRGWSMERALTTPVKTH